MTTYRYYYYYFIIIINQYFDYCLGSIRSTADFSQTSDTINEPLAILRFIAALSDTGEQETAPILGYQNELYCNNAMPKVLI